MTLGSQRATPLLIPFIKQHSCWFSSGPSQQALAQGESVAKEDLVRGGGKSAHAQRLFQLQAQPTSNHALSYILPVPVKRAGPNREDGQFKYILKLAHGNKQHHTFHNTSECIQQSLQDQSHYLQCLRCYYSIHLLVVQWHITTEEIMTRFIEMETTAPSPRHGWSGGESCMENSPTGNQKASQTEHLWFTHYTQLDSRHHSSTRYCRVCACF